MSLGPGGRLLTVIPLDPVQRDVVCTIFQDCVDQLSILGGIIPNYAEKPSALDSVMGGELKRILEGQRQLEEQFNQLTVDDGSSGVQQLRDHAHSINATAQVAKDARSVQESLLKLQRDREFLQRVVSESMTEITTTGGFTSLSSCLKACHEEKINMEQTILKEERSRKYIRQLKRHINEVKKAKEEEALIP